MYESLKGKTLLILGGIDQMVEVTHRCHELGIIVYVTDYLRDSPAKKVCDKSFMVSCTDVDSVVQLIKDNNVDGLYCGNNDMLLPYYAKICEKAGLPCYGTLENFILMTDKRAFKHTCQKYGVPTVKEYLKKEDVDSFPVIVKPIDSSGSRGITVCHNAIELENGITKALEWSPSKQFIIEKYMIGDEVVLYYYFQDGKASFVGMCDRYVFKQNDSLGQLPNAYVFPSKYTSNHLSCTDSIIKKMFSSIGMTNGPIFLQAFIENGIPYLYEPGYRTNGAREQYLVNEICGVSSVDLLINYALTGKEADYDIGNKLDPWFGNKYCCKLSPLIRKGNISSIIGFEHTNSKDIIATIKNNDIGDEIIEKNVGTLKQIAFRSYLVCDTIEQLKERIDDIQDNVVYVDNNNDSMMIGKFDTRLLLENYE